METQQTDNLYDQPTWSTKNILIIILKWIFVLIILVGSPIYLSKYPNDYTPMVDVMFSIFLFLLAYWIGFSDEIERTTKKINQKWLPQAESVVYRLLTLHSNVKRFAISTSQNCSKTNCDLPELQKEELKAVRIKIKTDCETNSQRLEDIARQLEDAIEDWRRFIAANCNGEECGRIFDAIQERQSKLEIDIEKNKV